MKKLAIYSVLFSSTLFAQTSTGPQPSGPQTVTPTTPSFNADDYFTGKSVSDPTTVTDVIAGANYLNAYPWNFASPISPSLISHFITTVFSSSSPSASDLRTAFIKNIGTTSLDSWIYKIDPTTKQSGMDIVISNSQPSELASASEWVLAKIAPNIPTAKALLVAASLSLNPGREDDFLLGMIPPRPDSTNPVPTNPDPLANLIKLASTPQNPDEAKNTFSVFTTILEDPSFAAYNSGAYISQVRGAVNSLQKNTFITSDQKATLNDLLTRPDAVNASTFVPKQAPSALQKVGGPAVILPKSQ